MHRRIPSVEAAVLSAAMLMSMMGAPVTAMAAEGSPKMTITEASPEYTEQEDAQETHGQSEYTVVAQTMEIVAAPAPAEENESPADDTVEDSGNTVDTAANDKPDIEGPGNEMDMADRSETCTDRDVNADDGESLSSEGGSTDYDFNAAAPDNDTEDTSDAEAEATDNTGSADAAENEEDVENTEGGGEAGMADEDAEDGDEGDAGDTPETTDDGNEEPESTDDEAEDEAITAAITPDKIKDGGDVTLTIDNIKASDIEENGKTEVRIDIPGGYITKTITVPVPTSNGTSVQVICDGEIFSQAYQGEGTSDDTGAPVTGKNDEAPESNMTSDTETVTPAQENSLDADTGNMGEDTGDEGEGAEGTDAGADSTDADAEVINISKRVKEILFRFFTETGTVASTPAVIKMTASPAESTDVFMVTQTNVTADGGVTDEKIIPIVVERTVSTGQEGTGSGGGQEGHGQGTTTDAPVIDGPGYEEQDPGEQIPPVVDPDASGEGESTGSEGEGAENEDPSETEKPKTVIDRVKDVIGSITSVDVQAAEIDVQVSGEGMTQDLRQNTTNAAAEGTEVKAENDETQPPAVADTGITVEKSEDIMPNDHDGTETVGESRTDAGDSETAARETEHGENMSRAPYKWVAFPALACVMGAFAALFYRRRKKDTKDTEESK